MQKRAVRTISSAARNSHTEPIFKELKLLNLEKIYSLNVTMFMFKHFHGLLPDVFGNMFIYNHSIHAYDTRQSDWAHAPAWRLEVVRRSIRVQGVTHWNCMSKKNNYDCSLVAYKCQLKRFLLNNILEIR